jgi:hypothetical protein
MVQNLLLIFIVLLCTLLIISILRNPFDTVKNPCRFKILPPKFVINGKNKRAYFSIVVEKKHRYFINFPLLFKFYSNQSFKTSVKISYTTEDESQVLLNKIIEFSSKVNEHIVYITDVIMGKITIEIDLQVDYGNPIIGFEIMQNSTCDLTKEHKLELKFPN